MRRLSGHVLVVGLVGLLLVGCGSKGPGARGGLPSSTTGGSPSSRETGAMVVTARVHLSLHTHHGADVLSGLRIRGLCSAGRVQVIVGHQPPYEPLRRTGIAAIDRTRPSPVAALGAPCAGRRFVLEAKHLQVRFGRSPLRARASGQAAPGVDVAMASFAIE